MALASALVRATLASVRSSEDALPTSYRFETTSKFSFAASSAASATESDSAARSSSSFAARIEFHVFCSASASALRAARSCETAVSIWRDFAPAEKRLCESAGAAA